MLQGERVLRDPRFFALVIQPRGFAGDCDARQRPHNEEAVTCCDLLSMLRCPHALLLPIQSQQYEHERASVGLLPAEGRPARPVGRRRRRGTWPRHGATVPECAPWLPVTLNPTP